MGCLSYSTIVLICKYPYLNSELTVLNLIQSCSEFKSLLEWLEHPVLKSKPLFQIQNILYPPFEAVINACRIICWEASTESQVCITMMIYVVMQIPPYLCLNIWCKYRNWFFFCIYFDAFFAIYLSILLISVLVLCRYIAGSLTI